MRWLYVLTMLFLSWFGLFLIVLSFFYADLSDAMSWTPDTHGWKASDRGNFFFWV
jgi:hypothetical protein